MDDMEIFRKLAQCEDKEQMQRCIEDYNNSQKPPTNADRIRAMSDEELCNFIMDAPAIPCDEKMSAMMKDNGCNNCKKCVMDWLQQPVKGE